MATLVVVIVTAQVDDNSRWRRWRSECDGLIIIIIFRFSVGTAAGGLVLLLDAWFCLDFGDASIQFDRSQLLL